MGKTLIKTILILLLIAVLIVPAIAGKVQELTWEDLIPQTVTFDDPFEKLDRQTLEYLGFVARIRARVDAGREVSQETKAEAKETEEELLKNGIDIDGLLARRDEIRELRKRRAGSVVEELDGTPVKMPGYVLPLEFTGRKVTEFLLVPWVGACIHTPPPPPNQIVHVVLDKKNAFESSSMYEPVWVAGEMLTRASTKNLFLKDGSGDISIAYKLKASLVKKYAQ